MIGQPQLDSRVEKYLSRVSWKATESQNDGKQTGGDSWEKMVD